VLDEAGVQAGRDVDAGPRRCAGGTSSPPGSWRRRDDDVVGLFSGMPRRMSGSPLTFIGGERQSNVVRRIGGKRLSWPKE
jgi:hypothetical protein